MTKKTNKEFKCAHIGHYKAAGQAIMSAPGKTEATIITTLFCDNCGEIAHNLSPIKMPKSDLAVPITSVIPPGASPHKK